MKEFLLEMIQGPKGEVSSKRVCAFILVAAGILYAFIALFIGRMDAATVGVIIGGATGILIGTAASHT